MVFRARDLLVRQRTQILNAIRGHLAEALRMPEGQIAVLDLKIGRRAQQDPAARCLLEEARLLVVVVVVCAIVSRLME